MLKTSQQIIDQTKVTPKSLEHSYGFDDVAIVPGTVTTNPNLVKPNFNLGNHTFRIPIIASAMDGVVDPNFAVSISNLGGFGVLNVDGVWGKYVDADAVLDEIANASIETATRTIQK